MASDSELKQLQEENGWLKVQVKELSEALGARTPVRNYKQKNVDAKFEDSLNELKAKALTVVIIGGSGHLAKNKIFPALYALFNQKLLPDHASIVGYARTHYSNEEFRKFISQKLEGTPAQKQAFLDRVTYFSGDYGDAKAFAALHEQLKQLEANNKGPDANRVFYFAIPPSVFGETAKSVKSAAMSQSGWNRVIVEKPFGKDSESYAVLSKQLSENFSEEQLYRIDHFLGKEMVQNLMILRFANIFFEPLWNHHYIANVMITFKENVGVEGRGGYYDEAGIIRDMMQNHLMQILTIVAMESPVTMSADDIQDEKVKVLRAIKAITMDNLVIGQYTADAQKKNVGYTEDPTVSKDSLSPTFAMAAMTIDNPRWSGVPFILKSGKGLNERKAEIRIQFKNVPGSLFHDEAVNELVFRVQPNEAIYLKMLTKSPGLSEALEQTELNLTYNSRFNLGILPDAYERLILDILYGDHHLFVRSDELEYAWAIFTPCLHKIDQEKIKPVPYPFGTRGPVEADELAKRNGVKRYLGYEWHA